MALTQKNRPAGIETPLGEDVLVLKSFTGTEQLGRLFEFNLELLSEDHKVKFDDIIGQNVTVWLNLKNGKQRHFNGCISRFVQTAPEGRHAHYLATVVPWFWFLTRTSDCRIFQDTTVPDIIGKVFKDFEFGNGFRNNLSNSYRQWEYCVQYRETAFNFLSRLMEQEGIYYFFEHDKGKHTLVLADAPSAHQPTPDYDTILFRPRTERIKEKEFIFEWTVEQRVQPGAYELTDFDFKAPQKDLKASSDADWRHAHSKYEIFDYPGEYLNPNEGKTFARLRLEELKAQHETANGETNARGVVPGSTFNLADYPRDDQNREYLITAANYFIRCDHYESSQDTPGDFHSCRFTAMEAKTPFRTPRKTPKPTISGVQTSLVTGRKGDEIYVDKYGRVKVQFHWDRYGKRDENSSCWIRVSQSWTGKGWGHIANPHIEEEVIVAFLEGNPDRPIIVGRVYNEDHMPPYPLPEAAATIGMKSQSTKTTTAHDLTSRIKPKQK